MTLLPCFENNPVNIYVLQFSNRSTGKSCEICSKSTMKTLERRQYSLSGVFIVNLEDISHLFRVYLSRTLRSENEDGNLDVGT